MKSIYSKIFVCLLFLVILLPQGVKADERSEHFVLVSNESPVSSGTEQSGMLQDRRLLNRSVRYAAAKKQMDLTSKQVFRVGQVKKFWVYNLNSGTSKRITATLRYQGAHTLVWIRGGGMSAGKATELGQTFDATIYPMDVTLFGPPTNHARSQRVNILCYPIDDGAGTDGGLASGYFDPDDLTGAAEANHAEVLYVDTSQGDDDSQFTGMETTLAHEFQHLINFSQRVLITKHQEMATWLNEGLAMAAEQAYSGHALTDRIDYYNTDSDISEGLSLTQWSGSTDTLGNYSLAYLFVQYLRIQCGQGTAIYKQLIDQKSGGSLAVQALIQRYIDPSLTFGRFMTDFRIALYLNEPVGLYGFHNEPGFTQLRQRILDSAYSSRALGGGSAFIARMNNSSVPVTKGADVVWINLSNAAGDFTPPDAPAVLPLSDHETVLSGSAEAGSTVTITDGLTLLAQTKIDQTGNFSVNLPLQKAGSRLYAYAEDAAGNVGLSRIVTVLDRTPPVRAIISRVSFRKHVIYGQAEAKAVVTAYRNRHRIGQTLVTKKGRFTLYLKKSLLAGQAVTVYVTDQAGNRSAPCHVTMKR